ncbi:retrovirus-related pol polyprotein from transposon TNT 1-94 [Tanacetum coccineum]
MKATKESRMQKIDSDLEEEEHLKTFLKLVPDEKGIIDYEVLEKRFPIINWESKFYHLDRHGAECIYYRMLVLGKQYSIVSIQNGSNPYQRRTNYDQGPTWLIARVEFFICLALTFFGYVPGMIYAIYVLVCVNQDRAQRT